ncbi:hypothetical protein [Terrabacter koreensis]
MADYTWTGDDELSGKQVPENERPARFALTAPQCIYRAGGAELLVVDPHPSGNWLSWMFPYASLVLTGDELQERGVPDLPKVLTFSALADYMKQARSMLESEYERNVEAEVNNIVSGIRDGWKASAFFENYSLKFSKTSNSFTAYLFEYRRSDLDDLQVDLPHLWIPTAQAEDFLKDPSKLEGRTVSSNVLDLVRATAKRGSAE